MIAHLHVTSFFLHAVNGEREKVRCAAIVRNVDCRKLSYINFVSKHICFERYHHAPSCSVAFLFYWLLKRVGAQVHHTHRTRRKIITLHNGTVCIVSFTTGSSIEPRSDQPINFHSLSVRSSVFFSRTASGHRCHGQTSHTSRLAHKALRASPGA